MSNIFSQRSRQVEIMDDLLCSGKIVDQTLTELDTINKWLGGNEVTIQGVDQLLKKRDKNKVISIADLGCGSGEMLMLMQKWAKRNSYVFLLT
jgi:ubiquinone/menaquinone biosynthesis C-methylase UbiE